MCTQLACKGEVVDDSGASTSLAGRTGCDDACNAVYNNQQGTCTTAQDSQPYLVPGQRAVLQALTQQCAICSRCSTARSGTALPSPWPPH